VKVHTNCGIFLTLIHDLMMIFSHNVMYFPAHVYLVMNISLFWFITKHKGKLYVIDEALAWLH
jgi:hypothetical protein